MKSIIEFFLYTIGQDTRIPSSSTKEIILVSNIEIGKDFLKYPFKINKVDINTTSNGLEIQAFKNVFNNDVIKNEFNKIFQNRKLKVIRHEDEAPYYSIIESKADYFKTIVMEGFYINQVNHELVKYLVGRKDNNLKNIDYNKKEISRISDSSYLQADEYNANEHIQRYDVNTKDFNFTNLYHTLNSILSLENTTDKNKNKFFMIANIRPDLHKFRQGALNTLDLVQELKST
jgi:hypothetical protein